MTDRKQIVLASRNAHKLAELQRILGPVLDELGLELIGDTGASPVENGLTFEANALIKARDAAERTGLPAIADDSGLCVEVMGGAPGILSARWSGPGRDDADNVDLLLWQLADIPDEARAARFVCAAALVIPGAEELAVRGEWPGSVLRERRGTGGFGYDPIFLPEGETHAAAELSAAEKSSISHRHRAFAALAVELRRVCADAETECAGGGT